MWDELKTEFYKMLALAFAVLLCFWFLLFGIASAQPRIMSEGQYQELMMLLERQDKIWAELESSSIKSEKSLLKAQKELTECQRELARLKIDLATAQQQVAEAKSLLARAEEQQQKLEDLFKDYQSKMERKVKVVSRQRNTWQVVCGILAMVFVAKG